jgi:hypothetical protein
MPRRFPRICDANGIEFTVALTFPETHCVGANTDEHGDRNFIVSFGGHLWWASPD